MCIRDRDVKYSIERCAGINGDGTPLVEAFSNVDKVEIPDESTIYILSLIHI